MAISEFLIGLANTITHLWGVVIKSQLVRTWWLLTLANWFSSLACLTFVIKYVFFEKGIWEYVLSCVSYQPFVENHNICVALLDQVSWVRICLGDLLLKDLLLDRAQLSIIVVKLDQARMVHEHPDYTFSKGNRQTYVWVPSAGFQWSFAFCTCA